MDEIVVEQALLRRAHEQAPQLVARSAGFADPWAADAVRLIEGYGNRTGGVVCKLALLAYPLNDGAVAVVRVADQEADASGWPAQVFHFLAVPRDLYEHGLGDPFALTERVPMPDARVSELPTLHWPAEPLPPRTVAQVQAVLKRVKAHALPEDQDPEAEVERTIDNSESPSLLGGAQVLVDGGKLAFIRPGPDNALVQGLWTLLPNGVRGKLRVATFAFSNALGFDVVVVPRAGEENWEGYTTEEQAADYPAGSYELAVQTAAEAGDQAELDAVFAKRSGGDTVRLAWSLFLIMIVLGLASRFFLGSQPPPRFTPLRQTMVAAGIVATAAGDPWTTLSLYQAGKHLSQLDNQDAKR